MSKPNGGMSTTGVYWGLIIVIAMWGIGTNCNINSTRNQILQQCTATK